MPGNYGKAKPKGTKKSKTLDDFLTRGVRPPSKNPKGDLPENDIVMPGMGAKKRAPKKTPKKSPKKK
jgi:hypothetical protein